MVVSPWAKKGHISHVLGSFVSVFATIERILNVSAMGRGDALAAPLWDMFTATPDMTAFDVVPRLTPVTMNTAQFPGAAISQRMSFRGPDRNPGLAVVLDAYRLWRMGRITRVEAQRRIDDLPWDWLDGPPYWKSRLKRPSHSMRPMLDMPSGCVLAAKSCRRLAIRRDRLLSGGFWYACA